MREVGLRLGVSWYWEMIWVYVAEISPGSWFTRQPESASGPEVKIPWRRRSPTYITMVHYMLAQQLNSRGLTKDIELD